MGFSECRLTVSLTKRKNIRNEFNVRKMVNWFDRINLEFLQDNSGRKV